eukprot:SAG31_NODE_528_length_14438_cov_2.252877_3_plen_68_part_00
MRQLYKFRMSTKFKFSAGLLVVLNLGSYWLLVVLQSGTNTNLRQAKFTDTVDATYRYLILVQKCNTT